MSRYIIIITNHKSDTAGINYAFVQTLAAVSGQHVGYSYLLHDSDITLIVVYWRPLFIAVTDTRDKNEKHCNTSYLSVMRYTPAS